MSSRTLGLAREISRGYDGLPDQVKELSPQHEKFIVWHTQRLGRVAICR